EGQIRAVSLSALDDDYCYAGTSFGGLTVGMDGALWFTESSHQQVLRLRSDGTLEKVHARGGYATPSGIAVGSDGNIWYANGGNNSIGRITMDGNLSEFPLPVEGSRPFRIVSGPDGALWFTELG